jgi:hypothetical protein
MNEDNYLNFTFYLIHIYSRWFKRQVLRKVYSLQTSLITLSGVGSMLYSKQNQTCHLWIQAYLVLLRFVHIVFFFTHWRFVATLRPASPSAPFLQQHVLTSCLCYILVIPAIFQTYSLLLYLLWWSAIFDVTIVIVWGAAIKQNRMLQRNLSWKEESIDLANFTVVLF